MLVGFGNFCWEKGGFLVGMDFALDKLLTYQNPGGGAPNFSLRDTP